MSELISVLTPSFNYGAFIGDAIASVRKQASVRYEHVVQDGASTDETVDILRSVGGVEWVSEGDAGQADALNRALARASGEWVAWLNADEFYLPGGLHALIRKATRDSADVVYGDVAFVDSQARLMRLVPEHSFNRFVLRHYGPFIATCALLIRRSALDAMAWDVGTPRILDWELYLRLERNGCRFSHVPYPVAAYRVHPAQISAGPSAELDPIREQVRRRYSIPDSSASRTAAVCTHRIQKALQGSYVRQHRASSLRGRGLRWFDAVEDAESVDTLLWRAYGLRHKEGSLAE